ncbi:phosphoheptose isomerase [Ruaniaceae bacterium KH17]|nr:phosphoheptose isomerase [Ruaniaceae bacterium KH17]
MIAHLIKHQLDDHFALARQMSKQSSQIEAAADLLWQSLAEGGCVYTFGNGGSAAEAQHFAGELIGHYSRDRRPLSSIALSADPTVMSCIANDYGVEHVFARQIESLARSGDVAVGFSTSGTSENVISALRQARKNGATTILFTGAGCPEPQKECDIVIVSPSRHTARIQEMHQLAMHIICEIIDTIADDQDGL